MLILRTMYVMDEFCDNWLVHKNPYDYADQEFRQWWEQDLTAMVIKNYNHPSVIMNSIGNEISELAIPEGQELCRKMAVLARELDPDKAVTLGINMMLCSMAAKGGGIYGDKKDGKENKNGSQTMDNLPAGGGGAAERLQRGHSGRGYYRPLHSPGLRRS